MRLAWLLLLGIPACDDGEESDADESDTDTDTDADSDTEPEPQLVVLSFTGTAVTVTGTPFGLSAEEVRGQAVTGTFTYDLTVPDGNLDDPTSGEYDHLGGTGAFEMTIIGHTITGSGKPVTEVQNAEWGDTWRFTDGPQFGDDTPRVMKVDGNEDAEAELWVSLVPPDTFFSSDAQPESFPTPDFTTNDYPHTFSLDAAGGGLLMQLDTLEQTSP